MPIWPRTGVGQSSGPTGKTVVESVLCFNVGASIRNSESMLGCKQSVIFGHGLQLGLNAAGREIIIAWKQSEDLLIQVCRARLFTPFHSLEAPAVLLPTQRLSITWLWASRGKSCPTRAESCSRCSYSAVTNKHSQPLTFSSTVRGHKSSLHHALSFPRSYPNLEPPHVLCWNTRTPK